MSGWPEEVLEEIRLKADIVDVISNYVRLTKKGKNYLGLCPFHSEKTPSFTVTPDKQMFYCFGCQTGGNVFTFLMKQENIGFAEAVKLLAEQTGVKLPEAGLSPEQQARQRHKELIAELNKAAKDFYHETLLTSPHAQAARDYLNSRGIDRGAIESFQLGMALDGWSNLSRFLSTRGYSPVEMAKAGLVTLKEDGGTYDRFRNRVIFPILNVSGQVIGFGGRVLDDSLPKYLNSPENELFNKGQNLYGIYQAHKVIREKNEAIVVEGYMDVITAQRTGFRNAVASLGTALTRDQGKLILRYTHNVLLSYDSDAAGIHATERGGEILRDLGCRVRVLSVPDGKDPDEFLRSHEPEEFSKLAETAPGFVSYKLQKLLKERVSDTIQARVEIVSALAEDIVKTESLVEREGYIHLIAGELGISEEALYAEIRRISAKGRKNRPDSDKFIVSSHTNMVNAPSSSGIGSTEKSDKASTVSGTEAKLYRAENLLLRLMLAETKVIALVAEQLQWREFSDPIHNRILHLIKTAWEAGNWDPANLAAVVDDDETLSQIAQMTVSEVVVSDRVKAALDCIQVIRHEERKKKINFLQEQTRLMQNSGDIKEAMNLLRQIEQLIREQ